MNLLGELCAVIRAKPALRYGLYYSMFEWYNPLWLLDSQNKFKTNEFVTNKTIPELKDFVLAFKIFFIMTIGMA